MNRRAWFAVVLCALAAPAGAQTVVEYIHTDALGSIVAITDAQGAVIEEREYEPYGLQLAPTPIEDGPGYTGHVQDAQTGLTYMQQRYYDPGIGRFLSVDPIMIGGDGWRSANRYWYADANPLKFFDQDGRKSICRTQATCVTIEIDHGLNDSSGDESSSKFSADLESTPPPLPSRGVEQANPKLLAINGLDGLEEQTPGTAKWCAQFPESCTTPASEFISVYMEMIQYAPLPAVRIGSAAAFRVLRSKPLQKIACATGFVACVPNGHYGQLDDIAEHLQIQQRARREIMEPESAVVGEK